MPVHKSLCAMKKSDSAVYLQISQIDDFALFKANKIR